MNKFAKIVSLLILGHLITSLSFIFFPSFLKESLLVRVYKHYFLPGPFFSENRITDSNYLLLSWKSDNHWSEPVNPAMVNFKKYFSEINPRLLYRSRFERTLYQQWVAARENPDETNLTMLEDNLKRYFKTSYAPGSDSVRIVLLNKRTGHFKVEFDTLKIFEY